MKKLFTSLTSILTFSVFAQQPTIQKVDSATVPFENQMTTVFQHVNLAQVTTHLLLDRAFQLARAENYDGVTLNTANAVTYSTWQNLYGTLFSAAWEDSYRLPDPVSGYLAVSKNVNQTTAIPIAIINCNYHKIRDDAVDQNLFSVINNQLYDVPGRTQNPYLLKQAFAASPVINTATQGNLQFILQSSMIFGNTGKTVQNIQVNFSDGLGLKTLYFNSPVQVNYTSSGKKYISIQVNYTDGTQAKCYSALDIHLPAQSSTSRYFSSLPPTYFSASRSFNGHNGRAVVTVGLGCGHTKLIKPFIVVEGFDPPQIAGSLGVLHYDNFIFSLITSGFSSINLFDELENGGYDIVYIDFIDASDYIQANAYVVEDVINWANQQKAQNGSTEVNVVLGESMGGLVARYALREMELLNQPHQTGKFISFDSPYQGANVPFGFQEMALDLASTAIFGQSFAHFVPELSLAKDILLSPASQQMMIYHADPNAYNNYQKPLFSWFRQNGYPNCELVSVSNGSQIGQGQGYGPGAEMLHIYTNGSILYPGFGIPGWQQRLLFFLGLNVKVDYSVHALPDNPSTSQEIYRGKLKAIVFHIPVVLHNITISVKNTKPFDSSPGGIYDPAAFGLDLSALNSLPAGIQAPYTYFCFVPSVSSVDLKSPDNQNTYANIQTLNVIANNKTPFQKYSAPIVPSLPTNSTNELHIDFSSNNVSSFKNYLIDFNQSLSSIGSLPNLNNVSYNFGKNITQKTTEWINQSININSGSAISVNRNQNLALPSDGLNPPTQNSIFTVYVTGNCFSPNSTVTINQGGKMILGEASPNNKGIVRFTSGSILHINAGGTLIINDNSQLVIESGAKLIYESGAQIQLSGNNAVLDIQGQLQIANNTQFTFSPSNPDASNPGGFVRFSNTDYSSDNIIAGTGSSIVLNGQDMNDKVLEITQESMYAGSLSATPLALFQIVNGLVAMGDNARMNVGCMVTFNNVRVTSTAGGSTRSTHRGLALYGQEGVFMRNVSFENGLYGLSGWLSSGGAPLTLNLCTFKNCHYGLFTHDKGATLNSCTFINSDYGWYAEAMSFPCSVNSCTATNNVEGIHYKASGVSLQVNDSYLNHNYYGLAVEGASVTVKCGTINQNTSGIDLLYNGSVRMDNSASARGSQVNASANNITITAERSGSIYLNGGNNDLTPGIAGNPAISGTIAGCGTMPSPWYVRNNKWNNQCTFSAHDYSLKSLIGSSTTPCTPGNNEYPVLVDDGPIAGLSSCGGASAKCGGGGGSTAASALLVCTSCNTINTTDFSNVKLNKAVQTGIDKMNSSDAGKYKTAVNLFCQAAKAPVASPTDEVQYVLDIANQKMIESLGDGVREKQISCARNNPSLAGEVKTTLEVQDNLIQKHTQAQNYYPRLYATLDKAQTYRLAEHRDLALALINTMSAWVHTEDMKYVQGWKCMIEIEQKVLSGQMKKEDAIAAMASCSTSNARMANIPVVNTDSTDVKKQLAADNIHPVQITPNPNTGTFNVDMSGLSGQDISRGEFELYDLTGKKQFSYSFQEGQNKFTISEQSLSNGVYFCRLVSNGKMIYQGKMVVIKE